MPTVSVVIPTHNRDRFLKAAIQSVLNQTFQDFELIVVDDASTDRTVEVVQSFADPRITYIRHETNKGGAAARNNGIRNASGKYIAFLDDDDEWMKDKLRLQVHLIDRSPDKVGLIYTGYEVVDRDTGRVRRVNIPTKRGDLSSELLLHNCLGSTSSALLKRNCLKNAGLFDEALPSFQDYDLWIRISRRYHFDYIELPLFKYHIHSTQIWTNPEAIVKGIAIMLSKYENDTNRMSKYFSHVLLRLGVLYCYASQTRKGRQAFLRAIRMYPFEIRHYFNFVLALFGPHAYKVFKTHKAKHVFKRMF
jgi:glycosyltransferase involved in cell wall biosynthesis